MAVDPLYPLQMRIILGYRVRLSLTRRRQGASSIGQDQQPGCITHSSICRDLLERYSQVLQQNMRVCVLLIAQRHLQQSWRVMPGWLQSLRAWQRRTMDSSLWSASRGDSSWARPGMARQQSTPRSPVGVPPPCDGKGPDAEPLEPGIDLRLSSGCLGLP